MHRTLLQVVGRMVGIAALIVILLTAGCSRGGGDGSSTPERVS